MYQFIENSDKYISLHDCVATGMAIGDREISFTFSDGICIGKKHPRNTYGKTLRTDEAQVAFNLPVGTPDDNVACYVYYEKKSGNSLRKKFSVEKLMRRINDCSLKRKKKPGRRECILLIRTDGASYRWNELCPQKKV